MPDDSALWITATRIEFRVSKDRSGFLLTVHSQSSPPVEILFPKWFGPELLEQVQNMVRLSEQPYDPNPSRDPKAN